MPKFTRIYTRTGDDGTSGLVGGQRVAKDSPRLECYGTVDELSAAIGVARSALRSAITRNATAARLDAWLAWVQDALFNLGSDLATLPNDRRPEMPSIAHSDVAALERAIDETQNDLEPLNTFIHPGGSMPGALLHQARTVCRRAERLLVALRASGEDASDETLQFLNRLSDALFTWSRWINHALGEHEDPWNPKATPPD
jgi:cob(I)alamin adenosyltransferase